MPYRKIKTSERLGKQLITQHQPSSCKVLSLKPSNTHTHTHRDTRCVCVFWSLLSSFSEAPPICLCVYQSSWPVGFWGLTCHPSSCRAVITDESYHVQLYVVSGHLSSSVHIFTPSALPVEEHGGISTAQLEEPLTQFHTLSHCDSST